MKTRRYALALSALALAASSFAASAGNYTFSNTTAVQIPDTPPNIPVGHPSTPYGTAINVISTTGTITELRVTLNGYSHTCPADVSVMLVGPGGQQVMLMGRVGAACNDASGTTLAFSASAASTVVPEVSGTYLPGSALSEPFPAPAPAVTGNTDLTIYDGTSANGTWTLFITDQFAGDSGSLSGGWSLDITTEDPTTCASEGYTGTKLTWCQNVCEKGYTGATLDMWIHRWINRYRDLPYCVGEEEPELPPQEG